MKMTHARRASPCLTPSHNMDLSKILAFVGLGGRVMTSVSSGSFSKATEQTGSTINSKKFLAQIEEALKNGGIDAAMEVSRNTRGPIASIYYQGLSRYNQGLDAVEKSVVSYGSVQTGLMESGLSWIGLFIALSPMLGFMGTVVGMIAAFDAIQAAGDISPTLVAGGIKVALLTTLMGLIAAVILQLFYNYIVSKIDSLVNEMEDTSIILMDMLTAYKK